MASTQVQPPVSGKAQRTRHETSNKLTEATIYHRGPASSPDHRHNDRRSRGLAGRSPHGRAQAVQGPRRASVTPESWLQEAASWGKCECRAQGRVLAAAFPRDTAVSSPTVPAGEVHQPPWKQSGRSLGSSTECPHGPAHPLRGVCPRELKTTVHTKACTPTIAAAHGWDKPRAQQEGRCRRRGPALWGLLLGRSTQ